MCCSSTQCSSSRKHNLPCSLKPLGSLLAAPHTAPASAVHIVKKAEHLNFLQTLNLTSRSLQPSQFKISHWCPSIRKVLLLHPQDMSPRSIWLSRLCSEQQGSHQGCRSRTTQNAANAVLATLTTQSHPSPQGQNLRPKVLQPGAQQPTHAAKEITQPIQSNNTVILHSNPPTWPEPASAACFAPKNLPSSRQPPHTAGPLPLTCSTSNHSPSAA